MTSDQNKYSCLVDSGGQVSTISLEHAKKLGLEIFDECGNIVKTTSTRHGVSCSAEKKSRYDAGTKCHFSRNKHRIKDSSKLEKQLKKLENRFDMLDDDLIELKWEIDDIKKILSEYKSKNGYNTSSNSSESD